MKSCWIIAAVALLVIGLVLVAGSTVAGPLVLDIQVIGVGAAGGTCQVGALAPACTSNSTGTVMGKHIGNSTYSLSLTAGTVAATNITGGSCLAANSLGDTITAANGDVITFKTVGWLCEEEIPSSNYHYNGTYRIAGGTGRFASAVGGGNLSATFVKGIGGQTFLKFDGTINY
jgi:hypothetical protein